MSETTRSRGKKKVRKAEPGVDPEFQIAPMIDILLVLLVFFMSISSTEVLQSNKNVKLPIAKEAKQAKDNPGQVIINVTYSSINSVAAIEVDEKTYPYPADLQALLVSKVAANPLVRVVIRADREVRFEYMRSLLQTIGQSGVGNVTFSVVDKESSGQKST